MSMHRHTIHVCALLTVALLSTPFLAQDAEACSPPIENTVRWIPDANETIGPDGRLFFYVENAHFNQENVALLDEAGQEIDFEIIAAGSFFGSHMMVVPLDELDEGAHTLVRTPGADENDLTPQEFPFFVDASLERPDLYIDNIHWSRAQFTAPVSPNTCLGEVLEESKLDITVPFWGPGDVVVHVAVENTAGEVIRETLLSLDGWHTPAGLEPPPVVSAGFSLYTFSHCVAVTAYHTSGAISATERTCQPQRCATVTPEEYGFGPVPEDAFKACPDEDTGDDIDHVDDEDIVDDDTNDDIDPDDNTGDETGNNQDGWDIDDNGENSAEIEDGCQSTTNGGLPGAGIWLALGLLFGLRRRKQS
jgi:uncharacterized protein (TIGR03382 family)